MNDLKVLAIVYPSLGIGEAYTAVKFTNKLKNNACDIYFIGTECLRNFEEIDSGNFSMMINNEDGNHMTFEKVIKSFHPDMIVFTDYHMLVRNKSANTIFNFQWIFDSGIPCFIIDTVGDCEYNHEESSIYEDQKYILKVPDWVKGILRPVPPHDPPDKIYNPRILYFNLLPEDNEDDDKLYKQNMLGTNLNVKNIVFPLGHWVKEIIKGVDYKFYISILPVIMRYFSQINDYVNIYILGDSNIDNYTYKNVSVKKDFINLSFTDGNKLIKSSDLVITINCFSNCLVRAAYYKVPTLTFINRKDIEVRHGKVITELDYNLSPFNKKIIKNITNNNGMIKKYMIFPENKLEIMEQFYKKNHEFGSINPACDIFDEEKAVKTINDLLFYKDRILIEHQNILKNKMSCMTSIYEKIEELM